MLVDVECAPPLLYPLADDLPYPIVQYADDTVILVHANEAQVRRLKTLLDNFAAATGLTINYHKSTFVPIHIPTPNTALATILDCPVAAFPQNYLGLLLSCKKLPTSMLDSLAIHVERCISGCRVYLLNKGKRLTLTNSMLTAQLTYAAAAIKLPESTIERVDKPCHGML